MPLALARSAMFLPTALGRSQVAPGAPLALFAFGRVRRNQGRALAGRRSTGRKYGSTSDTHSAAAARRCREPSCGCAREHAAGSAFFDVWVSIVSVLGRRSSVVSQNPTLNRSRTTVLASIISSIPVSAAWPTTEDQRPTTVTSLRSYPPSSSGARPHSARPCSCTDRADAGCAFRPRPVRLSGGRCR